MTKKATLAGVAVIAVASVGSGAAMASAGGNGNGDDDDGAEVPITGAALERASAVALEHTGNGRVTETEVGDEESYYEVEVTLDNGHEVDVQLDEDFGVVGVDMDEPGGD